MITEQRPWYRQLWPWLILLPPLAAVVAGIATLMIASDGADVPISDAVERRGLVRVEDPEALANAREANLGAYLSCASSCQDLRLSVSGDSGDAQLVLALYHRLDPQLDQTVELIQQAPGQFSARLDRLPKGEYRLRLGTPNASRPWLLLGEFSASSGETLLTADG